LIIVMSVMNGFRADLLGRILGLNGHLGVYAQTGPLADFDAQGAKISKVPGSVLATATPAVNEFGNRHGLSCASNRRNYGRHISLRSANALLLRAAYRRRLLPTSTTGAAIA
jgi:hypothetical protein